MALGVHNFTDLVNLQTVCKSTDLQVYKSIDSPCQKKKDFVFAFSILGKIAACTKHSCGRNMLKIIMLKNLFEFIVLVTSMSIKHLPEIFLVRFVSLLAWQKVHICMQHSQPTNYIVYSVREETCTARDRFFISRIIIE